MILPAFIPETNSFIHKFTNVVWHHKCLGHYIMVNLVCLNRSLGPKSGRKIVQYPLIYYKVINQEVPKKMELPERGDTLQMPDNQIRICSVHGLPGGSMQQEGYGTFEYKLEVSGNLQWVIGVNLMQ